MMVDMLLPLLLLTSTQQTPPKNHTVTPGKIPGALGPTPPRQTQVMAAQMVQVQAAAAVASAAAKPRLLKLLSEPGFTTALNECCPELVLMTPQQRLDWFDAESAAAEMVHNFGSTDGNDVVEAAIVGGDESIDLGSASKYFHNLWEIELLRVEQGPVPGLPPPPPPKLHVDCTKLGSANSCENASRANQLQIRNQPLACKWRTASSECVPIPNEQSQAQVTDIVEVGLFGFPAFAEKNASSDDMKPHYTFAESINRPIYTAFNHRKVDVGNPQFGHTSAIFMPSYVRNMTLIAPVDTGAWDPQCNSTLQSKFNRGAGGVDVCQADNASTCNDDAPQRIQCDWRRNGCVDTFVDRELCPTQITEQECKVAQGKSFDDNWFNNGQARTTATWWGYILRETGCRWALGACSDFECSALKTKRACNASSRSHFNRSNPATFEEITHKCIWRDAVAAGGGSQGQQLHAQQGQCVAITPDMWCADPKQREEFFHVPPGALVPPGASEKVKCEALPNVFSGLCRYSNTNTSERVSSSHAADSSGVEGRCMATECADLTTAEDCSRYSTKKTTAISCAWDHMKQTCLEYGGNCNVLPDRSTCVAEMGCLWSATNVSHGKAVCHAGKGHVIPGINAGDTFNCSFEHWKYPDNLVLGTPTHYYHILEAGVSIWTNNVSAANLGTLFGRMAAPKQFNITGAEVFRYWEANIAGAPLYPDGIKMLVGSFGDLFGTILGRRLQAWCVQRGWVLAWALGNPSASRYGDDSTPAPYANRTLDPMVFARSGASHNLSLASSLDGTE
eukprot:COSAG02_NODE_4297_length_5538_cov_3.544402_5_plen_791_part_00